MIKSPSSALLLGMFVKDWQPGQVKSRLAATIGAAGAAKIYEHFVRHLLRELPGEACGGREAPPRQFERQLCVWPPEATAKFAKLAVGWSVRPQADGDLGAKITDFFRGTLRTHERVVLIGSDAPQLTVETVAAAFDALTTHDAVLGPARDGGYVLIGLRQPSPRNGGAATGLDQLLTGIFRQIDWSTSRVHAQTTERLLSAGLRVTNLPESYDIDNQADLHTLLAEATVSDALGNLQRAIRDVLSWES